MDTVGELAEQKNDKTVPGDDKSRFLKNRTKLNDANDYHPSHNPESVANVPQCSTRYQELEEEEERDLQVGKPANKPIPDEEMNRLQRELVHLPFDTVVRLLTLCENDVDAAIEKGKNLVVPDLVPKYAKDIIVANMATERATNPTRGVPYKDFYFKKTFGNVVDSKSLVEFYYNEKNKINGNWRLDRPEQPISQKQLAELDEKMKKANISIIVRDPVVSSKQSRNQKGKRGMRRANRLKREEPVAQVSQEKEAEAESDSGSSTEGKDKVQAEAEYVSVLGQGATSIPDPSLFGLDKAKAAPKKRKRKTAAEKQVGPRRSYPARDRKPSAFYE